MKRAVWQIISVLMAIVSCQASAQPSAPVRGFSYDQMVAVCPYLSDAMPESFLAPNCQTMALHQLDPQQQAYWVEINFDWPHQIEQSAHPLGLYWYGKGSVTPWLNGVALGTNGTPAADKTEVAGKMDMVFYLPEGILQAGNNRLVMALSGQHSLFTLGYPIHFVGIGPYQEATQFVQPYSAYGLVLVGMFIAGALYFLALAVSQPKRNEFKWFAVMCALAGIQLAAELSRGLISYPYPWHDIRLLTVTLASLALGLSLLIYRSRLTMPTSALHWIYTGGFITVLAVLLVPGFDSKTTLGILLPLIICVVQQALIWWRKRQAARLAPAGILLILTLVLGLTNALFHEILFFVVLACLLVYLFAQQARQMRLQEQSRQQDQLTITKLEYRLEQQHQQQEPTRIDVSIAGRQEFVEAANIVAIQASGDYSDITLVDGSQRVFSGTLKQLESLLPSTFLRVHRSFLINLQHVITLERNDNSTSNNGVLTLTGNVTAPVSRRLLPEVRASIREHKL